MIKDYFLFSFNNLRRRKLRSWLTIIGVFIGIAAVVSLLSLGQGLQETVNSEFADIGTNRITIQPGAFQMGPPGTNVGTTILTDDDLDIVRKTAGVDVALGAYVKNGKVEFREEEHFIRVMGLPTEPDALKEMKKITFFDIESGRMIANGDSTKATLGDNIALDRFDREITTQDRINIEGQTFDVVGIHTHSGVPIHDSAVKIPIDAARKLFGDTEKEISLMIVLSDPNLDAGDVAERIKKNLRKHRDLEEGDEDFQVATVQQTIDQLNQILSIVTIFLAGVAAISLIVGGIGIANTMYTSIIERRKEVGIMKAIGAKNIDIGILFMIESGLLGMTGGVIGIIFGITLAKIAELVAHQLGADIFQASMNPLIFIGALLFAFIIGSLSGFAPAMQAARLSPVEALRK